MQATSLTKEQVVESLQIYYKRIFLVKSQEDLLESAHSALGLSHLNVSSANETMNLDQILQVQETLQQNSINEVS